ncbi:hypothetical protein KDU71_22670 [Carboxylicivirga sediminis]|uniref:Uncharacterized protein n=1 Tax=Carboxylicivirga sediminis TaxID=2006564 RepID=A0A941J3F5_9BACT|nr:hypothetical protein [Carboxylicivirga sediminis]MBR8538392.1 hypothetical protein [Carboxylicivirga sediminis]
MIKKVRFALFVILISLLNLLYNGLDQELFKLLTSILGIVGASFHLLNKKWSTYVLQLWAYSQILIIEPFWDNTQIFSFTFGVSFDSFGINISILGLIYSGIVRFIFLNNLIGKEVNLIPFRNESFLAEFLPSRFKIERIVKLGDEKGWFLVQDIKALNYALVRPKNRELFNVKKVGQILQYRIVSDIELIKDKNKKEDFKTGDFVKIE